jgi:hypothetical protein
MDTAQVRLECLKNIPSAAVLTRPVEGLVSMISLTRGITLVQVESLWRSWIHGGGWTWS